MKLHHGDKCLVLNSLIDLTKFLQVDIKEVKDGCRMLIVFDQLQNFRNVSHSSWLVLFKEVMAYECKSFKWYLHQEITRVMKSYELLNHEFNRQFSLIIELVLVDGSSKSCNLK